MGPNTSLLKKTFIILENIATTTIAIQYMENVTGVVQMAIAVRKEKLEMDVMEL